MIRHPRITDLFAGSVCRQKKAGGKIYIYIRRKASRYTERETKSETNPYSDTEKRGERYTCREIKKDA